jgi:hypothetical protein
MSAKQIRLPQFAPSRRCDYPKFSHSADRCASAAIKNSQDVRATLAATWEKEPIVKQISGLIALAAMMPAACSSTATTAVHGTSSSPVLLAPTVNGGGVRIALPYPGSE